MNLLQYYAFKAVTDLNKVVNNICLVLLFCNVILLNHRLPSESIIAEHIVIKNDYLYVSDVIVA